MLDVDRSNLAAKAIQSLLCGVGPEMRRSWMLAMFNAFIDDSGSDKGNIAYVLAGPVALANKWEDFSREWEESLDSDGLSHFKMAEANALIGPFKSNWRRDLMEQKVFELASIIRKYADFYVSIMLDRRLYENMLVPYLPKGNKFKDPYCVLFHNLLRHAQSWKDDGSIPGHIDFVFDEQGKVGTDAFDVWARSKEFAEKNREKFDSDPPIFRSDKRVVALQAADLIAWNVRRAVIGQPYAPAAPLEGIPHRSVLVDKPSIQKMVDAIHIWMAKRDGWIKTAPLRS